MKSITETMLAHLNLEQLRDVRRKMDGIIQTKEREGRFGVWVLEGWIAPIRYFPEADYVKAAEALLEEALALDAAGAKTTRRQLALTHKLLPKSEYNTFIRPA
jgi:hypothetical protein